MTEIPFHETRPGGFELRPASMPAAVEVIDGIWVSEGFSNTFCIPTTDRRVVINTGMGFESPVHKRNFDAVSDAETRYIIATQGHVDHVGGVAHFRDPETQFVAHEGNPAHQAGDERIAQYRIDRSGFAFGDSVIEGITSIHKEFGSLPPQDTPTPDLTFSDSLSLACGDLHLELLACPGGETNDSLVVWIPDRRIALVGNFFSALIGHIPNLVTLRGDRLRDPLQFISSANRILDLNAEVVLPGHHGPVTGSDVIRRELTRVRDATQYVHDATVEGMNDGRSLWDLMQTIELPSSLTVGQGYGRVSWDVRAIWEMYAGWFKHESTTELYGSPRSSVDHEIIALAGGADAVAARADELLKAGDPVRAIHLAEIAGSGTDSRLAERVLADAHAALQGGEDNFWMLSWLRHQEAMNRRAE